MSKLAEQIAQAKSSIRKIKRAAPWLYYEYHAMKDAEAAVREARVRLKKCRANWKRMGK